MVQEYPREFLERLERITNKRAKVVINHILEHGYITTEELERDYGYHHPPRAARDVKEAGIPLERFGVKNSQGRQIAAYRFGDISKLRQLDGRKSISKAFKQKLIEKNETKCGICLTIFPANELQVDHRVPYEIKGELEDPINNIESYMLLCGSCNRAKSWSCEHCPNWLEQKDSSLCQSCYWAAPESYKHIASRRLRRIDLVWTDEEIATYEKLEMLAKSMQKSVPDYVKIILKRMI